MNKKELIHAVADKTALTSKNAEAAVVTAVQIITETLSNGDSVQLTGFGTFEVRSVAAHVGCNPRTGKKVQVPARHKPAFKASKALKEAVTKVV